MSPLVRRYPRGRDRRQDLLEAHGFIAENYPYAASNGSTLPTSGDARGAPIYLYEDEVVSNIHVAQGALGSALTHFQCALYDFATLSAGPVASSTDDATVLAATGIIAVPLTAPYSVAKRGVYFPVFWIAATTTVPSFHRAANGLTGAYFRKASGNPSPAVVAAGLSALPGNLNLMSGAATNYWVAVS